MIPRIVEIVTTYFTFYYIIDFTRSTINTYLSTIS